MRLRPALIVAALCLAAAPMVGCDDDKDPFSGLSEMVAERQQVRQTISDKNKGNGQAGISGAPGEQSLQKKPDSPVKSSKKLDAGILFEKQIKIIEAHSNIPLARGVAYLDNKGHIVRIKIVEN